MALIIITILNFMSLESFMLCQFPALTLVFDVKLPDLRSFNFMKFSSISLWLLHLTVMS